MILPRSVNRFIRRSILLMLVVSAASDLEDVQICTELEEPETHTALSIETHRMWEPGTTLKVRFLGGSPSLQKRVQTHAEEWMQYANIKFVFGNFANAQIRISFTQGEGSWSYKGKGNLKIPQHNATMNLQFTDFTSEAKIKRTTLHEFGHALGFNHEHSSPDAEIPWDKPKVYEYYAGPPNYWDKEKVDQNVLKKYSETTTQFSSFDEKSIMLYPISNELTIGDFEIPWNIDLSATDKAFANKIYPFIGLYHATREADGSWNGFNALAGVSNIKNLEDSKKIDCAGFPGNILQCVHVKSDGSTYHILRDSAGSWNGWNKLNTDGISNSNFAKEVSVAGVGGTMHVVLIKTNGLFYHATRNANGSWNGFNAMSFLSNYGDGDSVDCAGFPGNILQCVHVKSDGSTYHILRDSAGSWNGWNKLNTDGINNSNFAKEVSVAGVGGTMHVVLIKTNGLFYHATRNANGSWNGFNAMSFLSNYGDGDSVDCAGFPGNILQCVHVKSDGSTYHILRDSAGSWNGWNGLRSAAMNAEDIEEVSVAGVGDTLHSVIISTQSRPAPRPTPSPPTRKRNFLVENKCRGITIRLAIRYKDVSGNWVSKCWWTLDPGDRYHLSSGGQRLETTNSAWYVYAESTDGDTVWSGTGSDTITRSCNGQSLDMSKTENIDSFGRLYATFRCNEESSQTTTQRRPTPSPRRPRPTPSPPPPSNDIWDAYDGYACRVQGSDSGEKGVDFDKYEGDHVNFGWCMSRCESWSYCKGFEYRYDIEEGIGKCEIWLRYYGKVQEYFGPNYHYCYWKKINGGSGGMEKNRPTRRPSHHPTPRPPPACASDGSRAQECGAGSSQPRFCCDPHTKCSDKRCVVCAPNGDRSQECGAGSSNPERCCDDDTICENKRCVKCAKLGEKAQECGSSTSHPDKCCDSSATCDSGRCSEDLIDNDSEADDDYFSPDDVLYYKKNNHVCRSYSAGKGKEGVDYVKYGSMTLDRCRELCSFEYYDCEGFEWRSGDKGYCEIWTERIDYAEEAIPSNGRLDCWSRRRFGSAPSPTLAPNDSDFDVDYDVFPGKACGFDGAGIEGTDFDKYYGKSLNWCKEECYRINSAVANYWDYCYGFDYDSDKDRCRIFLQCPNSWKSKSSVTCWLLCGPSYTAVSPNRVPGGDCAASGKKSQACGGPSDKPAVCCKPERGCDGKRCN